MQRYLFGDEPLPPHVHQDTSIAAAESVRDRVAAMRAWIHRALSVHPSTSDEIERITGFCHQTASARIRELVQLGRVVDSGERRLTRRGRRAIVWRVVQPEERRA